MSIKAKEIMIGDYFAHQTTNYPKDEYICVEVVGVFFKDDIHIIQCKDKDNHILALLLDELHPILIKEKNLIDLGFKKEVEEYTPDWLRYVLHGNFFLEYRNDSKLYFNGNSSIILTHIHELQHALKLSGLEMEAKL